LWFSGTFNSFWFALVFLPITYFGYRFFAKREQPQAAVLWLLAASMLFYLAAQSTLVWPLLASLVFNFACAHWLAVRRNRSWLLGVGVVTNLAFLLYFKLNLLAACKATAACDGGFSTSEQILIPLGISFFTFQQIAFLVDVSKDRIQLPRIDRYALFVMFFPQFVIGPIVHARNILPQFDGARFRQASTIDLAAGVSLFVLGLFKKVVIADEAALLVTRIFGSYATGEVPGFLDAWTGAIAFQFQLYFDFSGYADMAVGLALMFGLLIPFSFDSPHKSADRFEVWRRWNTTVTEFFRQHVFKPLIRRGVPPWAALMLTAIASGLWHGLGPTFLVWSLTMGVILLAVHYRKRWFLQRGGVDQPPASRARTAVLILITFLVTSLLGIMFRAPSFDAAIDTYAAMFALSTLQASGVGALTVREITLLLICTVIIWAAPNAKQIFAAVIHATAPTRMSFALTAQWAIFIGVALAICCVFMSRTSRFVYFQF